MSEVMPALLTRCRAARAGRSPRRRRQSSAADRCPGESWWPFHCRSAPARTSGLILVGLYPAAISAPWAARRRQIAAPIPHMPAVTSATRPLESLRSGSELSCSTVAIASPFLVVCERGPSHCAISGQISVGAFDPAIGPMCPPGRSMTVASELPTSPQWPGPARRCDVVSSRGDHEQTLLDATQVDPFAKGSHRSARAGSPCTSR